jgi:hypothetical protein
MMLQPQSTVSSIALMRTSSVSPGSAPATAQRIVVNHKKVRGWDLTPSHFTGQNLVQVWLDE